MIASFYLFVDALLVLFPRYVPCPRDFFIGPVSSCADTQSPVMHAAHGLAPCAIRLTASPLPLASRAVPDLCGKLLTEPLMDLRKAGVGGEVNAVRKVLTLVHPQAATYIYIPIVQ